MSIIKKTNMPCQQVINPIYSIRTRIANGDVPRRAMLETWGFDLCMVNNIRKQNGLDPVESLDPVVSDTPLTSERFVEMVSGLTGKSQMTKCWNVRYKSDGTEKVIQAGTVRNYISRAKHFVKCMDGDIQRASEWEELDRYLNSPTIRKESLTLSTTMNRISFVLAMLNYLPEFNVLVGPENEQKLRARFLEYRGAQEDVKVARSDDSRYTCPSVSDLETCLNKVRNVIGRGSRAHLALLLHLRVPGLRDDLQKVAIAGTQKEAEGHANYYVRSTGRLYISEHKTSQVHGAYDMELKPELVLEIEHSLASNPRRYLLGASPLGPLLKKTCAKFGLNISGVNSIRHALITDKLGSGASAANIASVAATFKHSPYMSTTYVRRVDEKTEGEANA